MARWIKPEKRLALYERASFACAYCSADVVPGEHTSVPTAATLDHVKPRNHGGSNSATNLVCCCARCNSRRQDTPLAQWAFGVGLERAEATVAADVDDRDAVVWEMARRLADEIRRRVRNETRRRYYVAA
jgi:hypothetical protein